MKNIFSLLVIITVLIIGSCENAQDSYNGKVTVTVQTDIDMWGYPQVGHTLANTESYDDKDGTWMYAEVGGAAWDIPGYEDMSVCGEDDAWLDDLADEAIISTDIGDKINIVYLFGTLAPDINGNYISNIQPVLYKGTSSSNNSTITITNIAPGNYYVVAFYDYNSGGKKDNILNRYDRYSIYDNDPANADIGTLFADLADTITVNEDSHDITLSIDQDWVLGKPNTGSGGTGRIFLRSNDPAMSAADKLPIQSVADYCP